MGVDGEAPAEGERNVGLLEHGGDLLQSVEKSFVVALGHFDSPVDSLGVHPGGFRVRTRHSARPHLSCLRNTVNLP
ncbi:hypothetical protein GCM10009541_17470 [Micromonospora gifhornensis]|uniref:Uncharacterized protein n=1 Tax=Micromonospora gifhornensis TaxID=84594 RepID=A0ABQ4II45_9ACTN|nr:hypothetical protein Vgi01_42600 [Micromonospora gifhornensis]